MSATPATAIRLPRPLPLLGHALYLLRDPWRFLAQARPLADVVRIRLGPRAAYVVNHPDLVRRVLVTDAREYTKGVQFDKLRPVLGNGLVTAAGEEHLIHRRLIQPAFHHGRISGYARTMRDLAVATVGGWRDAEAVQLDTELARLTLTVVATTMFSTELGAEAVAEVVRSMPAVLSGITKRALAPTQLLERLPTPGNRRFDRANASLRAVVDRIIAEYRGTGVDHGDMVSMLLLARDDVTGTGLSDRQVRDEVITMLLAGTETTANVLAWACHVLSQRPDLQARVQSEVDEVLGAGELTLADLGRLTVTRAVISETLRMYPPAWLITRRTREAVELGGVALPAGASVLLSPYALHRDPTRYAEPDRFDPDRWSTERAGELYRPAFIPFGAGTRQCIGEAFAWTEAVIILATIAQQWQLRAVPGVPVRMLPSATLAVSALPMTVRARQPVEPAAAPRCA
jgi:cytochrome P450